MADLVIGHFQDLAAAVLMAHIMAERSGQALPILEQVRPPLVSDLRPPVLSNNWGNLTETCMLDETFKALVRPVLVRSRSPNHTSRFASHQSRPAAVSGTENSGHQTGFHSTPCECGSVRSLTFSSR